MNRADKLQTSVPVPNQASAKLNALNTSAIDGPLSAIDGFSDQLPSAKNVIYEKKNIQGATKVPIPQINQGPLTAQQRKLVGDHYLAGGTLDSESDIHALQALSGIPSAGINLEHHQQMIDHGQ